MNVLAPVKTIMSTDLITVSPADKLSVVKEIFDTHSIHHLPVVRFKEIVGIISNTDFVQFLHGFYPNNDDRFVDHARLHSFSAEDIMTKGMAKLDPEDRINVALDLFLVNRFHAIPVIAHNELVGIVTPYDVMRALADEKISPKQILDAHKNYDHGSGFVG
jgi:acetoin utilization protein AcuB